MRSIASITITGIVGSDPKTPVASNRDFTTFSLAFSCSYKNKQNALEQRTDWYNCFCYNKNLSEVIKDQVKKGSFVVIIGTPAQKKYVSSDGKEKLSVEINVEKIALLSKDNFEQSPYSHALEIKNHFIKPADREAPVYFSSPVIAQKTLSYVDNELDDSIPF